MTMYLGRDTSPRMARRLCRRIHEMYPVLEAWCICSIFRCSGISNHVSILGAPMTLVGCRNDIVKSAAMFAEDCAPHTNNVSFTSFALEYTTQESSTK